MSKIVLKKEKPLRIINIILLSLAGAIVLLVIIGSIYAASRSPDAQPLFSAGNQARQTATHQTEEDIRIFSGLGQLRIPLANSSTLILTINFPYPANDIAFAEELAAKISELKAAAIDYFLSLPAVNLNQINEDAAKQEILRRFNNNLRLGKINALYFVNMLIVD